MTDLERTNLERPRINSNTTSNNPEWITQKLIFFFNYMANETKTNLQIIVQNKRRYVWKKPTIRRNKLKKKRLRNVK